MPTSYLSIENQSTLYNLFRVNGCLNFQFDVTFDGV